MTSATMPYDALLFSVADMLDLTLYMNAAATSAEGSMVKQVSMGPWKGKAHVYVQTDFIEAKAVGVLVKVRKSLWMYVVSFHPKSGGGARLVAYFFDGKKAGAKTGNLKDFCPGSYGKMMVKIKPHVGAVYEFTLQSWSRIDAANLDGEIEQQSTGSDQSVNTTH